MRAVAAIGILCALLQPCLSKEIAARALPAPVEVSPSQYFEGNDGPWSSFELRVGTPAQSVRVLPGTSSTSTIVVLPMGCGSSAPYNCADLRGGLFNTSASTTWSEIGDYDLGFEDSLGYSDAGEFGYDTVGLGYQGSGGPTINHSVVGGVAATGFYLGIFALNPRPTNFTTLNDPHPSFMSLLKNQSYIPSLSYSYTAGAPYRLNKALGRLILGGYDTSIFENTNSSFGFFSDQTRDLTVSVSSVTTNMSGETNLLHSGSINLLIDSSVAEIYLPITACQAFESAFNLTYNSTAKLYLVNDTLHKHLLAANPSVTFTIEAAVSGGSSFNVTLPYAAFDLTAEYPLVSNNSSYFPLKQAANDTQYTLGRTFLQEAVVIVDYERSNFSVHPRVWNANAVSNIITIEPVSSTSTATSTPTASVGPKPSNNGNSSISSGAIAGIVVGAVVVIIVIGVAVWWFFFVVPRRRAQMEQNDQIDVNRIGELEDGSKNKNWSEAASTGLQEIQGTEPKILTELESGDQPRHRTELDSGDRPGGELDGRELRVHELQGSEVPEMQG
ncbi:aspartic peptidase domain-containing protein [Talaromyces proteolyticus]|uniref:Aspartic peptidase domain-containing protein n=1 Tax=Talaromyces proteolyticus TaxID=1131652 RepID=A0AAD4PZD0_9EURO|nr:aspartic peptidase domain-containing protein [Talaromyces proteolyticus]KAH8696277.1 aspartic peptidase domain-containing protein [Talaromyces proteolyticus]